LISLWLHSDLSTIKCSGHLCHQAGTRRDHGNWGYGPLRGL